MSGDDEAMAAVIRWLNRMERRVDFSVPGEPVPKSRPKFARRGNFVHVYTPKKTLDYEKLVANCYEAASRERYSDGDLSVEKNTPVHMDLLVYHEIPKSWPQWLRRLAATENLPCLTRPDLENVLKAFMDGLNSVAYPDDAQVYSFFCRKTYSLEPRVEAKVRYLSPLGRKRDDWED